VSTEPSSNKNLRLILGSSTDAAKSASDLLGTVALAVTSPPYLRALRVEQGVALKVVAKSADVSVPYLSEVERGRKLPALDVLARIAAALNTNVPALLRGLRPYDC